MIPIGGDASTMYRSSIKEESKIDCNMKQVNEELGTEVKQHEAELCNERVDSLHENTARNKKRFPRQLNNRCFLIQKNCSISKYSTNDKDESLFLDKNDNAFPSLHVIRPYKCYLCDLVFDRGSQLDYHKRRVHNQERSQICQLCGKGFFKKNDLKTHLNIHLETNRCICEICGRKFNHVSNLIRHSRTHSGVKPYPCTVCGKRFTQINTLSRHKAIHERNKDESKSCCFCDKRYKCENSLKEHLKKSHAFSEKSISEENERIVKRQHYCKVCGESFRFIELLRLHETSHENLKILDCKSCNQKFEKTDEMKEHRCGRVKLLRINAINKSKKPKVTKADENRSNICNGNDSVLKQLGESSQDYKDSFKSEEICASRPNGPRNFTPNEKELNYKLIQSTNTGPIRLIGDKQTKETIVYVTTEQLANMNTEQVVDTANHFLHEHLMELAAESSLQTECVSSRDCDGETVVSEMINSCWKEIEMPNVNETLSAEQRNSSTCKNNTQNIIYLMPQNCNDAKHDLQFAIRNPSTCSKLETRLQNKTRSKKSSRNNISYENWAKTNVREQSHKQERTTRRMRESKTQIARNCFNEGNSDANDNLIIESTNPSITHNVIEELLKNSSDNVNAVVNKSFESHEPTLRLVQTENGELFYELLITNGGDKTEHFSEFDSITVTPINENLKATQNDFVPESMLKLVHFENGQHVLGLMQKNTEHCNEAENIDLNSTLNGAIIETSVSEDTGVGGSRAKNSVQNKSEKIFYLSQNHKDNLIDFFEIETLGTQEHGNTHLVSHEGSENISQTNLNNLQTLNKNKSSESIDEELLGLIQSSAPKQNEKMKNDSKKIIGEEKGPMVRLVQNEDGAQFFELIRGDLDFDEPQDFEIVENNESDKGHSIQLENQTPAINETMKSETDITRKKRQKSNVKIYNCDVCKKSFSKGYNYRQHIGTHFADQQKFKCKECGTLFAWKSTLNKHMASHRAGGQQKFVCEICPKVYTTLSQVNEHVKRDHLKERNHKCTNCAKTFFKKFDLKIHMRTHTKERPYECRVCYKSFHHQSHIIRHERIHSGERPYACNICEKTFTQLGSLKTHRQRHQQLKIDILDYQMDEDDPLPRVTV